ncbi:cupin domain-containing protein [Alicyclobacillus fodiniaquatilis]|jgi:mannose-6-phosphate isomerase-like protein (cupin superfamily)|uniref:Cupin domain-containing protein n=1 Tax=Alicyclobacillus fodiniaquatilis TaxID=1661150 RepID=A0ABW4JQ19_9BACL
MTQTIDKPIFGGLEDYPVYKISEKDSNKFALICDSTQAPLPFMMCIEIFDVDGATPVNEHQQAIEHFYVLFGKGKARIGDTDIDLAPGAHVLVPPQTAHVVQNTGSTRLYVLTTMIPDEDFSNLILRGIPDVLDEEDKEILRHLLK